MNIDEYQRWASDPLTVKFHRYLTDFRADLMERWAQGAIHDQNSQMMAMARCQQLLEITQLDDDTIQEFYRSRPQGESDAQSKTRAD